ncbi:MAG: TrkH family potassium uptake protein [Gammaproteobacteria bacterium]|nr:TrkH family potassium uptake protein [Gammaproteobacteria bacterium]
MSEAGLSVLIYAVRGRVVLKYCGQLALVLAVLTLAPLVVALVETNWVLVTRYLILCFGLVLAGGLFARLPAPDVIRTNEALTITVLAFLIPSVLMAWPMTAANISWGDAVFEAVSGITTTGLSALDHVADRPASFLFLRAWMQWYGGLGFIVLSVALLLGHTTTARRLMNPVDTGESLIATARTFARQTLIVYVCLTLFGFILIWPLSRDGFAAMLHVFSAVSTGGFSMFDNSLAGMPSHLGAMAVMAISFLSAVSLPLYWKAFHAGWYEGLRTLVRDVEWRALILACLLIGTALSVLAWWHGNPAPWYQGMMLGFSAQTTTGFATQSIATMDAASKLVMMFAMLIGGSVGSSAGGFKILRLLVMLRAIQLVLRRAATPAHAVVDFRLGEQKLAADDVSRVLLLILLYIIVVAVSWLPFIFAGYDPLDSLFEVISACGTVGLSTGITRPELSDFLKLVLCFDMLAGRVEIVALLVVLYPRNWFGRREVV